MRTRSILLFVALCVAGQGCDSGKRSDVPPVPSAHDPKGDDLVEGAVVAATETSGGIRLNKIVHVDDFPLPLDHEFHMIAYDPKSTSWDGAARMWKDKQVQVIVPHFIVRKTDFMVRDYRVLGVEPVTPEEKAPYDRSKAPPVPMPR